MKKAFTLIELLIVIAIIGILAVAVLLALDPIEQTNRARDTQYQAGQTEIRDAIQRYFSSKLRYPWCTTSDAATNQCTAWIAACANGDADTGGNFDTACPAGVIAELQAAGELKTTIPPSTTQLVSFVTRNTGSTFWIFFNPVSKSKSIFVDDGTYFTDDCTTAATVPTDCTAADACNICVQ